MNWHMSDLQNNTFKQISQDLIFMKTLARPGRKTWFLLSSLSWFLYFAVSRNTRYKFKFNWLVSGGWTDPPCRGWRQEDVPASCNRQNYEEQKNSQTQSAHSRGIYFANLMVGSDSNLVRLRTIQIMFMQYVMIPRLARYPNGKKLSSCQMVWHWD